MGKRSTFARKPRDFYATPAEEIEAEGPIECGAAFRRVAA